MKRHLRPLGASLLCAAVVALAACSSSTSSGTTAASGSASSSSSQNGGTITIVSGTAPLSADQGLDFTTQGNELYSVVNTPLLTFKRGVQGVRRIADPCRGWRKALPTVSNGGKTYTFIVAPRPASTPTGRRSRPAT